MRVTGRGIYVTSLENVLAQAGGPEAIAATCVDAKLSSLWLRLGRGAHIDANFSDPSLPSLRKALDEAGIALWGWHVPFCADMGAAKDEAAKVLRWAAHYTLAGVLIDAERTPESPRFRGGPAEADTYAQALRGGLVANGQGIALSSHDQPVLHQDLPFAVFLGAVNDNCPQVYYQSADVATRFNKSVAEYSVLEKTRDFKDRFKPTGNITVTGDVRLPDVNTCLAAAKAFIDRVHTAGFTAYSFWCWDEAPAEIWTFFREVPV
ncbi:MAG TPA: hypothetical protein VGG45_02190 [Terracidiphilus sp.]